MLNSKSSSSSIPSQSHNNRINTTSNKSNLSSKRKKNTTPILVVSQLSLNKSIIHMLSLSQSFNKKIHQLPLMFPQHPRSSNRIKLEQRHHTIWPIKDCAMRLTRQKTLSLVRLITSTKSLNKVVLQIKPALKMKKITPTCSELQTQLR